MIGSTERRTMIAAAAVAVAVAAAIVGVADVVRGGGADSTATTERSAEEEIAERGCRDRFSVGFSEEFADAACPFYVPRALAGASNDEIIALPEFRVEICVEAGRIRYESGEVATRLERERWLDGVRVDCREEIGESP